MADAASPQGASPAAEAPAAARSAAAAGLRARALRGTVTSLLGHGGAQALRLVSNLILARLLFPEAFGVMALVWVVVNALAMLSDVGVQPSVVRDARGDEPSYLRTAFSIQALRGGAMWLASLALAAPFARLYGEPQLALLVPVAGLTSLIAGFESPRLLTLSRHLALDRLVAIDLGSQAVGVLATIGHALVDPSVWALVTGALAARASRLAASYLAVAGPPVRFGWDRAAARSIGSFGRWVLVSTMITFVATRVDVLLLGKLLPIGLLGVYSIGSMISQVPATVASRLARAILMPVLSAANREGREAFERHFARARRLALPAGLLAVLASAAAAPAFVAYLYDPRYRDAGWIAQLSMIAVWFTYLQFVTRSALEALGDSRILAAGNAVRVVATVAGCAGGYALGGLPGLIVGLGLGAFCGYLTTAASLRAHGVASLRLDLAYTALAAALGGALGLGSRALARRLAVADDAALTLALGALLAAPLAGVVARRLWGEARPGAGYPRAA
jgi:O-antigen/teichoic acid export membrane protein